MTAKFNRETVTIKNEPVDIRELQVTKLDGTGEISVKNFEPSRILREGDGDYASVKARFGSLAVTDEDRPQRTQKNARFSLNPLLRDPLSVEAEEKRAIETRISQAVSEVSAQARLAAEKTGYDAGFQRGKQEALEIFSREGAAKLDRISALLAEFEGVKPAIFKANERFLIGLVFQVAKRIALKDVQADKDYVHRLVSALIDRLDLGENILIEINPQDQEAITAIRAGVAQQLEGLKNIQIRTSNKVPPGGCQVETDWGVMSASTEASLAAIEQALVGESKGADVTPGSTQGSSG